MGLSLHQKARQPRLRLDGFHVSKDEEGRTGFTRIHEKGHLHTRAAIARVLGYAADARRMTPPWRGFDHAAYIDRVRQLRKRGTWL